MNDLAIQYFQAETIEDFEDAAKIFIEYQHYLEVDLCFQEFENELKNLKNIYKKPLGTIILARNPVEIMGCVAIKPIEKNNCEMKRLFVKPNYQGLGIGHKLVELIIEFAKTNNYQYMKLDTLEKLKVAIGLYQKFGFEQTKPYVFNPLKSVYYFEKKLVDDKK